MNEYDEVREAARQLATAIGRRDQSAIREWLAPGFVHRALGGDRADAAAFFEAIAQIPGDIMSVTLEQIVVDPTPSGALVTGVQHAEVVLDGQVVQDRRAFVDWFVKHDGRWRIQAAVDLPHQVSRT
jgi:ketosteroid isomerase-like protein